MSNSESFTFKRIKGIIELLGFLPLIPENMEELFLKTIPSDYSESAKHLINARIETLKSIKSLLEKRIKKLETIASKIENKEIIRETIEVE